MVRGIGSYQKTETLGKSPIELLLMVYGGAIGAMEEAEAAFTAENRDLGREKLDRARKFVTHLYTTLDNERGGDIATQLGHLYVFVIERLQVAQASGDASTVADVRVVLENLRSGWQNVEKVNNG